jgi:hypothetical protein
MKTLRITAGILLTGAILALAQLAVQDCQPRPYIYENCLWMEVSGALGIPSSSRLGRAATLFVTGVFLLAALAATIRFVFPRGSKGASKEASAPSER